MKKSITILILSIICHPLMAATFNIPNGNVAALVAAIKLPSEFGAEKAQVQVFALDGKLILEKEINKGYANSINLTSKGTYMVKTTIGTQVFTNKIIVKINQ